MGKVFGVGINDADYNITYYENGIRKRCEYYTTWTTMLARCYYMKEGIAAYKAYEGCTVDPEWHNFMSFRSWMEQQDWKGKQLDKDLLVEANKVYGPRFCVFISGQLNKALSVKPKGTLMTGVTRLKSSNTFRAQCYSRGICKYLGVFKTEVLAHEAYLLARITSLESFISDHQDARVEEALNRIIAVHLDKLADLRRTAVASTAIDC